MDVIPTVKTLFQGNPCIRLGFQSDKIIKYFIFPFSERSGRKGYWLFPSLIQIHRMADLAIPGGFPLKGDQP